MTDRTSLSLPPRLPLDEWQRLGTKIFTFWDSSSWWLGDWLVYGQANYPDRYQVAVSETGLSYQTLRNYAWIARQFKVHRRHPELSFQHHAEVAGISQDEQDRWLDRAERFGWSRNELRRRIKASLKPLTQNGPEETNIQVKVGAELKRRWETAAKAQDKDLDAWMIAVLNQAAAPKDGHTAGA
ncbi:hypothetical protein DSY14_17175 [Nocardiopsis sp. MG754419]|nr:hypothetical protein [Nocardiopsis sp. MG754419]